jgi:hypothetical protein
MRPSSWTYSGSRRAARGLSMAICHSIVSALATLNSNLLGRSKHLITLRVFTSQPKAEDQRPAHSGDSNDLENTKDR